MSSFEALESGLGYRFQDRALLRRALTHRSRAYEEGAPEGVADNERLEFLGDSILGFLVSEWLVVQFPGYTEGRLSKVKAQLVSASHLHHAAQSLGLGEHLLLGRGEEMSGGRQKKSLLADAMEALIAAVYLDGGLEPARGLVVRRMLAECNAAETGAAETGNFKGTLKEMVETMRLPEPRYTTLEEKGPDHAKIFVVQARVGRDYVAQAEGASRKSAEQQAAKLVLEQFTLRDAAG